MQQPQQMAMCAGAMASQPMMVMTAPTAAAPMAGYGGYGGCVAYAPQTVATCPAPMAMMGCAPGAPAMCATSAPYCRRRCQPQA